MKPEVLLGLGLAAGAVALAVRTVRAEEPGTAGSAAGGAEPFFGGGGYGSADPWTGHPIDPATGLPAAASSGPTFVVLSPDAEGRIIDDNERANAQAVQDQRDSLARVEQNTRTSNAFAAAAATAASVPFAIAGIAKHGPALGRSITAAARSAAGIIPPLSAPGATITQLGAVTGAGWAVGVTGGVALGLGGVKVLHATGALDKGEQASTYLAQHTPQPAQAVAKSLLVGPATLGAVATGLVGHGSVGGNVKKAWDGTVQQKVVNGGVGAAKKVWGWAVGH
jgi:hypothetical protein